MRLSGVLLAIMLVGCARSRAPEAPYAEPAPGRITPEWVERTFGLGCIDLCGDPERERALFVRVRARPDFLDALLALARDTAGRGPLSYGNGLGLLAATGQDRAYDALFALLDSLPPTHRARTNIVLGLGGEYATERALSRVEQIVCAPGDIARDAAAHVLLRADTARARAAFHRC